MAELLSPEILYELELTTFVALDVETTGLDSAIESIIEFGAVRYVNGEARDEISLKIHPGKQISEKITRITGITNDDVKDAPKFSDVYEQIVEFIGDDPVVGHNIPFDMGFLENSARRIKHDYADWSGKEKPYRYFTQRQLDTVTLARLYLPFLPSFTLSSLAAHFNLDNGGAHRALPDAQMTAGLFLELLPLALQSTLPDLQKILLILEPTDEPIKRFFEKLAIFVSSGKYTVVKGIDKQNFEINANHYNIIGAGLNPLPTSDDHEALDEKEVGEFFAEGGELSREFGVFEVREEQVRMAQAIANAFNGSTFLTVEAGTGTGKSMAYLIPALRWAIRNAGQHGRVVISTNTKNLQEQLFFKDLPILHSILGDTFKAVLLKGKGNYLCLDKWTTAMSDMKYRLTTKERLRLLPLFYWVQQTETGDISENNAFRAERNMNLWTKMIAENNYCPGKSCKFYDKCFLMKARNHARDAHLVLVNHSLLFSDLATNNAVLGEYVNVIFDEAHNLEKTATEYLGYDTTLWQFRDFLNKLYQKDRSETGVLIQLKRRIMAGKMKQFQREALLRMVDGLLDIVPDSRRVAQQFFRKMTRLLNEHLGLDKAQPGSRHRYTPEQMLFEPLEVIYSEFFEKITTIKKNLAELLEYFTDVPEDSFEYQRQLFQEISSKHMQADLLLRNLQILIRQKEDGFVYWFELPTRQDSDDTRLYAAPLDVGELLEERLFNSLRTAVFTSATLAVGQTFNYFQRRIGLDRVNPSRVNSLMLSSPFDYAEQVLLAVPAFLPDPASPDYKVKLASLMAEVAKEKRGVLGLFTSYVLLRQIYESVRDPLQAQAIPLLGQGMDGSRHALINRFKKGGSVLLGTDSFWEGIDVPGDALQNVFITKLPFDVPSDPVIQARSELIKERGGNAFMEFSVPEAVIRFRQGFGRLIRRRSDFGAVIITDTRVHSKRYGKVFLRSLPVNARVYHEKAEFLTALHSWFK
ncbi:MAG: helicase C-terminal domain-containing protein [Calditrichia bacterium]